MHTLDKYLLVYSMLPNSQQAATEKQQRLPRETAGTARKVQDSLMDHQLREKG